MHMGRESWDIGDGSVSSDLHAATSVATRCRLSVMRDDLEMTITCAHSGWQLINRDVLSVDLEVYLERVKNRVRLPVAWRVFNAKKRGELTSSQIGRSQMLTTHHGRHRRHPRLGLWWPSNPPGDS